MHRNGAQPARSLIRAGYSLVDKLRRGAMLLSVVRQPKRGGREEGMLSETLRLVRCKKCGIGTMLPLSDYGQDGAAILYKAWICDSPACGYNLRIDRGQVTYGDLPQLKSAQEPAAGRLVARRSQR